ncbi:MAG: GNAT family N-acetyltransferase [Microgenomates group bacterium]
MTIEDHARLLPFWKDNYFVNELDAYEPFQLFLKKNPNLSLLMEDNGEIIGSAFGSFDGRRGYIQKLVVRKDYRKQGIGRQLVDKIIEKLRAVGALYIPINPEKCVVPFYEKCGFTTSDSVPMKISYSTYKK